MPESFTPVTRTTLIIGYGSFGLDVLRRFLASTAMRGVLVWEEPGGADGNQRRLRDLALLWVRDPFEAGGGEADKESAVEGSHIEMLRDLYRQIQTVEQTAEAQAAFVKALEKTTNILLDAASRASRRDNLPLGLDIIVLAHPGDPAVIGRLNPLLIAGMERLQNYATQLERGVTVAAVLNFIQILDFENYWERSERGQQIRVATHGAVERWQERRNAGKAAFGRIYLVDSHTADGIRDVRQRIDEISLLLEFLLFESQRGGELQRLYQAVLPNEPLVATFGIRLMERSAGLLSRLAAARFGIDWLGYLAGEDRLWLAMEPVELRQQLAPYRGAELERLLNLESLQAQLRQRLYALQQQLAGLPVEAADWPQQVQAGYEQAARQLENDLTAQVHRYFQRLSQERLAGLPTVLRSGIEAALHHERQPAPLGAVIREVELALQELAQATVSPGPAAAGATALAQLGSQHTAFRRFQAEQLDAGSLRYWWPLFAGALGLGLTPLVLELLPRLSTAELALWLSRHPSVVAIALTALFWGLGAGLMQRSIRGGIERARRFWSDPGRGRLTDRLLRQLRLEGELGRPLAQVLDRLYANMVLSVRGEVTRELGQSLKHLQERRRELLWLQGQLREFLRLYGLVGDEQRHEGLRLRQENTGIRYVVEQYEDFERMLQTNPPAAERFLSMQADTKPFSGWNQPYSDVFLYPLRFIDKLSRKYRDPFLEELARPGTGIEQTARAREFRDFLNHYGAFAPAFSYKTQTGAPDRLYCLLPQVWLGLQGIRDTLRDLGVVEQNIIVGEDVARAYLLRIQTGMEPACLL